MNRFIKYTYESGEVIAVRRTSITSFKPTFIFGNNIWRVFITHNDQSEAIFDAFTCEACWEWIDKQIALIEEELK